MLLDTPQSVKEPLEAPLRSPCSCLLTAEHPTTTSVRRGFFQLPKPLIARFSDDTAQSPFQRSQAKRATVLIVDDDPVATETFARMLKLEGYDVRTALDAETGLREAEVSHLDAILLELRMPLVDGLTFLQRLRAREDQEQTPVAIVTGDYFVDEAIANDLRGLGAEVYFKPLWLEDLVGITQALVAVDPSTATLHVATKPHARFGVEQTMVTEGINILVVDDERAVLNFADRVLREAGYTTALASNGPEALEIAAKFGPFDLLLTDVVMPQMTGDELARQLRHADPNLKVLYLTAYSDRLFKEKVTLWEGEAFLDKPCSATGVLQAVSLLIFSHLLPPELPA